MQLLLNRLLLSALAVFSISTTSFAGDFLIRDGDRVVFLGDSITEQRLYTTYIEAYALTRYPQWKLSFRNVGWGGDTSWLRQRMHPNEGQLFAADETAQQSMVEDSVGRGLARDVLPLNPTFVTVKFGMNDHSYQPFREDIFHAYVRSQAEIAKVLKTQGARVTFLTPQPIEEKRPDPDKDPRNQSLRTFSDGLKGVAAKTESVFVDQFDPYLQMLLRERSNNPPSMVGGGDAVHPGPIGHTVMAWAVLKGMGATPIVSRVEINGSTGKISAVESCRVTDLKTSSSGLSFNRSDAALPMPIDEKAVPALRLAPILDDLNRYELRVSGLPSGKTYEVTIDGESVGSVTAEGLARGWNLAAVPSPITRQAQQLLSLVFQKNNVFYERWRSVQLFSFPKWVQSEEVENRRKAELARLDQQIADLEAQIESVRKPKPHHFELKAVGQ